MLYTQLRGCMIWNGLLKIQVSSQLIKDLRCLVLLIWKISYQKRNYPRIFSLRLLS